MRKRSSVISIFVRSAAFLAGVIVLIFLAWQPAGAGEIDAVRGKAYTLNGKHGPWMIMVTSFWPTSPEHEKQSAKAANELVYQLRKKGVPAYIHKQEEQVEEIESLDRTGRRRHKKLTSQHGMVAVLAGNYHNPDDKVAQQTLKFVKKFNPKVSVDWQGRQMEIPLDLKKSFMTRNPMLSPEELARKNRDPLIVKLNSSGEHSLFDNRGKYTLVVAAFYGKSQIKPTSFGAFDRMIKNQSNISLDDAAHDSWELMTLLRKQGFDAYVYHERFRSIVTVGAFKSSNDGQIARLVELFRAKEKINPETKQPALIAEAVQIPGKRKNDPPLKSFMLDPAPQLMEVPR